MKCKLRAVQPGNDVFKLQARVARLGGVSCQKPVAVVLEVALRWDRGGFSLLPTQAGVEGPPGPESSVGAPGFCRCGRLRDLSTRHYPP